MWEFRNKQVYVKNAWGDWEEEAKRKGNAVRSTDRDTVSFGQLIERHHAPDEQKCERVRERIWRPDGSLQAERDRLTVERRYELGSKTRGSDILELLVGCLLLVAAGLGALVLGIVAIVAGGLGWSLLWLVLVISLFAMLGD